MSKQWHLHVRISDRDHAFLAAVAENQDEKIATTVRRLIRQLRNGAVIAPASPPARPPARQPVENVPSPPALTANPRD